MESTLSPISNPRRVKQHGIAVFLFALCLIAIVPVMGLAIDVAMLYMAQSKLSAGADAAVLAAARGLSRGSDSTAQQANAVTVATNYVAAAFPIGFLGSSGLTSATSITLQANQRTVTTTASVTVPLMFMRWVGPSTSIVRASATATRRDVNVIMVIDRSGSMSASNSCTPMKAAASAFVGQFAPSRDYVGLITFSTDVQINNAASQSFSTVTTNINSIVCSGSTNTTQGLSMAYRELIRLNQPAALNVILLFTDGQPTVTPISSQFKPSGSCPGALRGTWQIGVIGGYTNTNGGPIGFWDPNATGLDQFYPNSTGCAFVSNIGNIATDVSTVAAADKYGNSTNVPSGTLGSYTVVPASPAINWTNLIGVATNTSYEAARHIRKGDTVTPVVTTTTGGTADHLDGVYIYTIGLGTAAYPADLGFLKDVANDLTALNHQGSPQNSGLFVDAPTSADLNPAFQRVASEVLRLAQ